MSDEDIEKEVVRLWQRAEAIAKAAGVDVNGVFNVLRAAHLSAEERIEAGLRAGRLGRVPLD
ncbi:MAG: hypothetical protein R3A47_01790 [Polyangiales bacterium]